MIEHFQGRVRPLTIGLSIGSRYGSGGCTLGVFVTTNKGEIGFLTSAMALGVQKGGLHESVYQPSSLDAGTLANRDVVGKVGNFIVVDETQQNFADAALVIVSEAEKTTGNKIPNLSGCEFAGQPVKPEPLAMEKLSPSTKVAKIGRTSGYTEGTVTSVAVSDLKIRSGKSNLSFFDAIEIAGANYEPFSASGDAGALVFTVPELQPIGLVFAAARTSQHYTAFACRLDRVLQVFQVELLS
jgi:hypothetical protein